MKRLTQIKKIGNRASCLCLGVIVVIGSCSHPNNKTLSQKPIEVSTIPVKQHIDSISLAAALLPEFKTDPHINESQGNQLSGVVRTLFQDHQGNFWFGTQNGLCRYSDELIYFDIKDIHGEHITVRDITQDKDHNLWVAHSGGITKFDGEFFTHFSTKNGLLDNDAWAITTDHHNTVWVSTLAGINTYDGTAFKTFDLPKATIDTTRGVSSAYIVHSITKDDNDNLWFGTNGGAYRYDYKNLERLTTADGLCGNMVNTIIFDQQGQMWYATVHNGLCMRQEDRDINISEKAGLVDKDVWSVIIDRKNDLWFSVKGIGIYHYDGVVFTLYDIDDGLAHLSMFKLLEDQQGRIWASGFGGAYRLENNRFVNVTRDGPWQ